MTMLGSERILTSTAALDEHEDTRVGLGPYDDSDIDDRRRLSRELTQSS